MHAAGARGMRELLPDGGTGEMNISKNMLEAHAPPISWTANSLFVFLMAVLLAVGSSLLITGEARAQDGAAPQAIPQVPDFDIRGRIANEGT